MALKTQERILIVDDNRALAKLIARKMESNVDMIVDVAHSFSQAQDLIDEHGENYFIALLDLNLPDAPDGEIVDYVLSKNILVIVLTGSIDVQTKESFIHKPIVDYVYKGNIADVNYIFNTVNRLSKNRGVGVMVVDDSQPMRTAIKNILKSQLFDVYVAAHGEEAMNYFEQYKNIKLVLTDYKMPVMDGLELTKNLREKYPKSELGIIVFTATDDEGAAATFLKSGANDFIIKPFGREELIVRINNHIENIENIELITNFANRDFLSGLYNRRYFMSSAREYIQSIKNSTESFAIATIDIDHFKRINDTYGHDIGDEAIKFISHILLDSCKGRDLVARFGGEEFCMLLKNISAEDAVKFFVRLRTTIASKEFVVDNVSLKMTASIGVCIGDTKTELSMLLSRTDKALYKAKEGGRNRVEMI
ncbi:diguanylate cyclase [Campylobacter sp. 19-13652]|uniref:GGDEF domain-containing response regulator n=1 Tax=Campylobacter sp. 19-13652 TaxID=2840180 RepID=UPI001C78C1B3|nr:diguanylate cyclase [Campylobacter sp. 19-13652]BCX79064.1 diguanylate cyclase response regulator [Campylobacter sp. 19-13652]